MVSQPTPQAFFGPAALTEGEQRSAKSAKFFWNKEAKFPAVFWNSAADCPFCFH
eukprot:CAMPEP_0115448480 /NCGR_PEP_ID=MMETSP0271-20121206/40509_1 /TAXON_ID=71861 /ORGANISM="Scrippsiella trochoidea, Strain CCMP3099" /LENGTH=53 /DNA_ID=CAMNT_0002874595 /DNA_START=222 /DNA_END=380 /DNA_ORIENTATION=-